MKDLKHIKRFNESEENLNISDVSDSNLTIRQLIINRINEIYTKTSGPKIIFEKYDDKGLVQLFENLLKGLYNQ